MFWSWKDKNPTLIPSKKLAKGILRSTLARLKTKNGLVEKYDTLIKEQEKKQYN